MQWPTWIETLRERLDAGEANHFLVVGTNPSCVDTLVRFLLEQRDLVGVLTPQRELRFPRPGDRRRLDRALRGTTSKQAASPLGQIWRAISTVQPQGWVLEDIHRLLPPDSPAHRPVPGAPPLADWPDHPTLCGTEHLVVCLAPSINAVHPELAFSTTVLEASPVHGRTDTPIPPSLRRAAPDRLERLQVAFALRTARQIAEADGVLHLSELELLVQVFPDEVLHRAGFLAQGGALNASAERAYADAIHELNGALCKSDKRALIDLFVAACLVDGHLHPQERAVLLRACRVLGLDQSEVLSEVP